MSCAETSIGVTLSEEDIRLCSELISAVVTQMVEEVMTAFEKIGEAFSAAFGDGFQSLAEACKELEKTMNQAKNAGTPLKKYGMSLRRCPRRTSVHYDYIPRAPRNLPYIRRAY